MQIGFFRIINMWTDEKALTVISVVENFLGNF